MVMLQMNIIYIKRRLGVGEQGDPIEISVLYMDTTWLEIKWLNIRDVFVVPVLVGFADQVGVGKVGNGSVHFCMLGHGTAR